LLVFGQSFGGLLGYEVVRRLGEHHGRWPVALVVAACRSPEQWVGTAPGLAEDDLDLTELLDARRLGPVDLDEESRELLLDAFR
jgi:surfactin synthase thioesterase subunit